MIHQSPEKERTEEEKAVDQLLGPAQKFDLEVASPPGKSSISNRFNTLLLIFLRGWLIGKLNNRKK